MPNWTYNEIHCSNPDVIRSLVNENGDIDFNLIFPMSDDLKVTDGSITRDAIVYYISERLTIPFEECKEKADELGIDLFNQYERIRENMKNPYSSDYEDENLYALGKRYLDNKKKYGCFTWYAWCCNNWGTKWNASCSMVDGDFSIASFETAWCLPDGVFRKLCEMFPDEEIDFCGEYEDGFEYTGFNHDGTFNYELVEKPYEESEETIII